MPPRPGPRGAAGPQARSASAARSAPFSVHARGVPLFDGSRFWDLPRHVARLLLDFRDISSATGWWLACQTWLSFWSAVIAMLSGQSSSKIAGRAGWAGVPPPQSAGGCHRGLRRSPRLPA